MRDPRRAGIASGNNRHRAQQQNHGRAFRRIVASGYEPEFTAPALIDLLARYGKDCSLAREDGACVYPLELHCGLLWAGRLEHELQERIGSEAVRKPFRDVSAFALSPEWEFLYLAVHAARHGWLSLKWFIDLDRLCSAGRVDWEKVKREAKLLGCERALRASLAVCASLLDTPVPPTLMSTGPLQLAEHRASVPRPSDFQVESEILFHLSSAANAGRQAALPCRTPVRADAGRLPISQASAVTVLSLLPPEADTRDLQGRRMGGLLWIFEGGSPLPCSFLQQAPASLGLTTVQVKHSI